MFVLRRLVEQDAERFIELALTLPVSITSLPKSHERLHKKVQRALDSFNASVKQPGNELYLFVLEEVATGNIVGLCAIAATSGLGEPTYWYTVVTEEHDIQGEKRIHNLLTVQKCLGGPSEVCSLWLEAPYRGGGNGKLLSLSRLLYMAAHPQRFQKTVMTNLRGIFDKVTGSIFWESVGRHFIGCDFDEMLQRYHSNPDIVPEMLPRHPIDLTFIKKRVKSHLGKVHEESQAAYKMLRGQGFRPNGLFDVFDAGPVLTVDRDKVDAIRRSKVAVAAIGAGDRTAIVTNEREDFRSVLAQIGTKSRGKCILNAETAAALKIREGDPVRYYVLR